MTDDPFIRFDDACDALLRRLAASLKSCDLEKQKRVSRDETQKPTPKREQRK